MNISVEDYEKISAIVQSPNSKDLMENLIKIYASQSVDHATHLIEVIPAVSSAAMQILNKYLVDSCQVSTMLINQRCMEIDKEGMYFASMVPVCKQMFPKGTIEGHSKAQKEYFDLFLKLFKDKKQFDWNNPLDISWAKQYEYYDYLAKVKEVNNL